MLQEDLKRIVKEGGALAKEYFSKGVTYKTKAHLGDLVTEADNAVSDLMMKLISEAYPDHGIYSEEKKDITNPESDFLWMIDPIDGTRNFAHGIPIWCVMTAIFFREELFMSAMYDPLSDELFFAEKGKGATMNGLPISVNNVSVLDHGYGSIVRGTNPGYREEFAHACARVTHETDVWMHNFGTMLLTAYIASGGVDFYAGNAGFDHDNAAPALICAEAGALVTDIEGNPWKRGRRDIVIANPNLHPKILELFS